MSELDIVLYYLMLLIENIVIYLLHRPQKLLSQANLIRVTDC